MPTNIVGTVDPASNNHIGGMVQRVWYFDDINTYNTSGINDNVLIENETLRMRSPSRQFTVYRNNKPLAKSQQAKWIDTQASTSVANGNPLASMNVRITYQGFETGAIVGYFKLCWYVTMRG